MVYVLLLCLMPVGGFFLPRILFCADPWAPRMPRGRSCMVWQVLCQEFFFCSLQVHGVIPAGKKSRELYQALSSIPWNLVVWCRRPLVSVQVNVFKMVSPEAFPENCYPCLCLKNCLVLNWSICRKQTGPLEHLQRASPNEMRLLSICVYLNYWISPSHGSGLNMYK